MSSQNLKALALLATVALVFLSYRQLAPSQGQRDAGEYEVVRGQTDQAEAQQIVTSESHPVGAEPVQPSGLSPSPKRVYSGKKITFSAAQDKEDDFANNVFFKGLLNGTILESGALDGLTFSTSQSFERDLGWRAIHVEAGPRNFKLLEKNRPKSINIHCALCKTAATLHFAEASTWSFGNNADAVAGIVEFMHPKFRQLFWQNIDINDPRLIPIQCKPLQAVLDNLSVNHIDFWVLDVEGAELEVLQTIDLEKIRVDVICIELDGGNAAKDEGVRQHLLERGYRIDTTGNPRNTWFVRKDYVIPSVAM